MFKSLFVSILFLSFRQSDITSDVLVRFWFIFGLFLVRFWFVFSSFLVRFRFVFGSLLIRSSVFFGLFLVRFIICFWFVFSSFLVRFRFAFGSFLVRFRSAFGLHFLSRTIWHKVRKKLFLNCLFQFFLTACQILTQKENICKKAPKTNVFEKSKP